jgi:hypothetical protein
MGARPNRYASFCTDPGVGALVEFPGGIVSAGFSSERRPAAQWFNYFFNLLGGWIYFLRGPSPTNWQRFAWGPTAFDAATRVPFIAGDATTEETTSAIDRFVVAGNISGAIKVYSSRSGVSFTDRTATLPGGLVANPVLGLTNVVALTSPGVASSAFFFWTDAELVFSVGVTGWTLSTLPGGYKPRGVASAPDQSMFVAACEAGGTLVWATSTGPSTFSAGGITGTPTGAVQGVVWTGAAFVFLTANGEVWSTPDTLTAIAKIATITSSANWRLATDGDGTVIAYEVGVTTTKIRKSTDHGATWSTVTVPSTLRNLTQLIFADLAWCASTTEAPYVWFSNDVATWVRGVLPVPETGSLPCQGIAYASGSLVASVLGFAYVSHRAADAGPGVADGLVTPPLALVDAAYLQGREIDTAAPSAGDVLVWSGSKWSPDVINAVELQGSPVSATTPTAAGQGLIWDGAAWRPDNAGAGSETTTDATPTALATVTLPAKSVAVLWVTVSGVAAGGAGRFTATYSFGVQASGTTASVTGTAAALKTDTSGTGSGFAVQFTPSGLNIAIEAVGLAATTIFWSLRFDLRSIATYP